MLLRGHYLHDHSQLQGELIMYIVCTVQLLC